MSDRDRGAGGRGRPYGIERAERTPGAPPPRTSGARRRQPATPRPDLPRSVEPDVPRAVLAELRRHTEHVDDIARALTIAADLVWADDPQAALPYLQWCKQVVPRSGAVREALAVTLYLAERWQDALSELQAYRRLTDRQDQNHLIADCQRALDRPLERIAEAVRDIDPERDGEDRYVEGLIVWASALADRGDPSAGRAVLARGLHDLDRAVDDPQDHDLRLWYVAGDLAERDGDPVEAERWFRRVVAVDAELFDAAERLERIRDGG